ncbi:MAG: ABC transporter permease [Rhizobiales bacterium]|nr:ABC transporter permease [Hyphomicrobiales bacterium]
MKREQKAGLVLMSPPVLLLIAGFLLPLAFVAYTSLMPPRTFGFTSNITLENYVTAVRESYWRPMAWSVFFALATTILTMLISWPIAKALVRKSRRFATIVATMIAVPVFIAETVRLFGAHLFLMPRGGILAGTINYFFGIDIGSVLFTPLATLIGLLYIYLPFALFPTVLGLSQVPADQVEAAQDLGASPWQQLRYVEVPIASPGIIIGSLLVFVLVLGATSESHMLGGQSAVPIGFAIEQRFNYAQDWPLGSALATVLCLITALLVFPLLSRLDLDRLFGR